MGAREAARATQWAQEYTHMQTQLDKRQWVADLWEECRHDETMRDFLFGDILDDAIDEDAIRKEIKDELYDEVETDLVNDPSKALREALIEEWAYDPPDRLRAAIADDVKADYEDEIGDLKLQIANLEEALRVAQKRKEKP